MMKADVRVVAVERGQIVVTVLDVKQVRAQRHQFARAARCAIEAPKQFLPPRLRCEMQGHWRRRRSGSARQASIARAAAFS